MQFSTLLLAFIGIASESVIAEKIKPYPHYFGCEGVTWAGKSAPQPICGKLITPPVTPTDFNSQFLMICPMSHPKLTREVLPHFAGEFNSYTTLVAYIMYVPGKIGHVLPHEGTVDFHLEKHPKHPSAVLPIKHITDHCTSASPSTASSSSILRLARRTLKLLANISLPMIRLQTCMTSISLLHSR
ncbi:hypothetical protein PSTT_05578 [Puccinia striiformis]|uniref:Uncharacterized protein n=1 Tax=Puccinia striiformis TaxID=27350 RepID=A0A2S4VND3_9BASI|nr:hypothetical protein PSTT_05578 [Puccinia striiformis]